VERLELTRGHDGMDSGATGQSKLQRFKDMVRKRPDKFCQEFDARLREMATDPRPSVVMERFPLDRAKSLINFSAFAASQYELLSGAIGADGRVDVEAVYRARAMAAATFAGCEQAAMDGGRWDLAQLMLLAPEPNWMAYQGRKAPAASTTNAHARTADPGLICACVQNMKDAAAILKARAAEGGAQ